MWITCSNTGMSRVLHKQMTHSGMCLTHVSKNTGYCLHVESGIEVRELAAHGKSKRVNTDTSLTCKYKPMVRLYDHNSFLCVRLSLFIVNPYCTRRTCPPAHDSTFIMHKATCIKYTPTPLSHPCCWYRAVQSGSTPFQHPSGSHQWRCSWCTHGQG